jgi:quercetin dioxygenase-like cupin family protein
MEFEAEGFGAGKKWFLPGDSTEKHNSGNYREIVYCLDGTITVFKEGILPITLVSGEITYIPPETKHEIKNLSDKPAKYFFVFSKMIESEKKPHQH